MYVRITWLLSGCIAQYDFIQGWESYTNILHELRLGEANRADK